MNRILLLAVVLCTAALLVAAAGGQEAAEEPADTLEGVLKIHPKFHYRYYIESFGDGQRCALFLADEELKGIKPGSVIRVRGDLKSKFFGNVKDPNAALASTWIIYMDVAEVEVVRE